MDSDDRVKILLIDDNLQVLNTLEGILASPDRVLVKARSGKEALRILLEDDFALILLDVQMPVMDGFDTATLIHTHHRSRNTPIIFLTAHDKSEHDIARGYQLGAVDYLFKPIVPEALKAKVEVFASLHRLKKDETIRKRHLEAVFNGIDDVIYVSDPETHELLFANERLTEVWGAQAVGRKCYEVLQRRASPCPFCTNDKIFGENLGKTHVWEFQNEVTRCWYRCSDKAIPWVDGRWVRFELATDITAQKDTETRLREFSDSVKQQNSELQETKAALVKLTRELERSNRELDDFAYIASHDLREPLRGIHNYARFILEDYHDLLDEEGRAKLETLPRLTQRLEDLIDALLTYSRVGRTEQTVERADLHEVVEGVIDSVHIRLQERGVEVRIPERLPTVECQRHLVTEVFRNLVTNALKYNESRVPWIEIGYTEPPDGPPIFHVRDNGIGIREKHQETIFQIFKRLHARDRYGGGTGAGLTIVKKMVEQHNGRIWLESTFGEGTTFYFTLAAEPALSVSGPTGDAVPESDEARPEGRATEADKVQSEGSATKDDEERPEGDTASDGEKRDSQVAVPAITPDAQT